MTLAGLFGMTEVWAATSGAEQHAAPISQLLFPVVNFLIFLYLIKRFVVPIIQDYLRSRREGIVTALREADEGRKQAEATAQDYRGRLSRLEEESEEIRESLRVEGEREKTRLLIDAREVATKITEDAQFMAEQEVKVARQQIRAEMANRAGAGAIELVSRHISSADRVRLVEEFLADIGHVR